MYATAVITLETMDTRLAIIMRLCTETGNICTAAKVDIRRANACAEVLDHTVENLH